MNRSGAAKKRIHGNSKITAAMIKLFRQTINQPNRKDLRFLTKANLYRHFCGVDGNGGAWRTKISRATFYAFCQRPMFKAVHPHGAPFLTPRHIANRLAFAQTITAMSTVQLAAYLRRVIFVDGAIFSNKYPTGYASADAEIIIDTEYEGEMPTVAQYPQTRAYQLYQGVTLEDRTAAFLVNRHHPRGLSAIDSTILRNFLLNDIAPLAARMRERLNLGPRATIYIMWDHALVHCSKVAKDTLEEIHVKLAGLPARCPELNVIEVLWSWYKTEMKRPFHGEDRTSTDDEFKEQLLDMCNNFPQAKINNLVRSFGRRAQCMVDSKGDTFKYEGQRGARKR